MKIIKNTIYFIVSAISLIALLVFSIYYRIIKIKKKKKIIFGTTPIINNKYWSNAIRQINFESETLMHSYFDTINAKSDFDLYFDDLIPRLFRKNKINHLVYPFFVWLYIIKNAKIFVMPFNGVILKNGLWTFEYILFKVNAIKIIVIPYGADAYMYSKIKEPSFQNALLINYPYASKIEKEIEKKVFFWSRYSDITFNGFMGMDGMPRWDMVIFSWLQINTNDWKKKKHYSMSNGTNGFVKIIHTPNHRGVKGTEFLLKAVEKLQNEGLKIELILLEKIQNSKVRDIMQEADILAEQFVGIGYALSGIEAMSSGLPVLSNLDNEEVTKIFRRYSFLNECPVLSTTPETLKDNLRLLVTNPELRKELGELGRKYAEKYHSYEMAQHMFTHIFRKLDGEDIDLMNLYHPLKSEYVKKNYIKTPLTNNKFIPKEEV